MQRNRTDADDGSFDRLMSQSRSGKDRVRGREGEIEAYLAGRDARGRAATGWPAAAGGSGGWGFGGGGMEGKKKGATGWRGLFCQLGRFACPSRAQEFMIGHGEFLLSFFILPPIVKGCRMID
jgi:hypothetical protein